MYIYTYIYISISFKQMRRDAAFIKPQGEHQYVSVVSNALVSDLFIRPS